MAIKKIRKKTKIVATIGPASQKPAVLKKLMNSGLNVVRLNFSHGDHAEHGDRIKLIREVAADVNKSVATLLDISGPKIRIGDFGKGAITLRNGQKFTLTIKKCVGTEERVYVNYKLLSKDISVGDTILLDDGARKLYVTAVKGDNIETKVIVGGMIRSRRGVNLPDVKLSIASITAKDRKDIAFGVQNNIDLFALSFVRSANDVKKLRGILEKLGSQAKIIAKIETTDAIENIDAIISVTDGIMMARGDLAVEVGPEHVPHYQKEIAHKCNVVGKPVIVATQMLESMIEAPVPTRAEVSDVTNAIIDGADAIMLSGETAIGKYPVEAVAMMASIAVRTERGLSSIFIEDNDDHSQRTVNAVSHSVVEAANDIDAAVIVALTESGFTARKISRYKPSQVILALSPCELTRRQLMLSYGCYPREIKKTKDFDEALKFVKKFVQKEGFAKKGDRIVIAAGVPFGKSGTTNMMIVETV